MVRLYKVSNKIKLFREVMTAMGEWNRGAAD